jgi:hypothetical protein
MSGREVLVFVMLHEVPLQELSRLILAQLHLSSYIACPPEGASDRTVFWDTLAAAIQS